MDVRSNGVLEHHETRNGENFVCAQRVEQGGQVLHDARRPGVLRECWIRRREIQSELVFHVDDERIDLGTVRERDEFLHLPGALRREAVHVHGPHDGKVRDDVQARRLRQHARRLNAKHETEKGNTQRKTHDSDGLHGFWTPEG